MFERDASVQQYSKMKKTKDYERIHLYRGGKRGKGSNKGKKTGNPGRETEGENAVVRKSWGRGKKTQ